MIKYLLALFFAVSASAVILPSNRVVDWTVAGVEGGIPTRNTISQTVSSAFGNDSTNATSEIQSKIAATAFGQVCYIPPGRYRVNSAIVVTTSDVTVRGANAFNLSASTVTIGTGTKAFTLGEGLGYIAGTQIRVVRVISGLNFDSGTYMQGSVTSYTGGVLTLNITTSANGGGSASYSNWRVDGTVIVTTSTTADIFSIGTSGGGMQYNPVPYSASITGGSTRGSTAITVDSLANIGGSYLVITDLNAAEVSLTGFANSPTQATWVDGWNDSGARARGQIVKIVSINGLTINITPALYVTYTNSPAATRFFATQARNTGIENLGVYCASGASTSGTNCNFRMDSAANCWLLNLYSDFASGDHVEIDWGYRCEVRGCFFEDAFTHTSGTIDSQVGLRLKSTNCLIIDNIMKRLHISTVVEWGAAGNVTAYNYMFGEYDQLFASGTRALQMSMNANHGAFPQFNLSEGNVTQHFIADSFWGSSGDNTQLRNWMSGIGQGWSPYDARGTPGTPYALTQGQYAFDIYEGQYRINAIGNIVGDPSSTGGTYSATDPGSRTYTTRYMRSLGYGNSAGSGDQSILPNPTVDMIYHGNYDYVNQAIVWDGSIADHTIPDSYFLSAKPSFFGNLAWPVFDVASPSPTVASIPAGYRYVNGVNPSGGGGGDSPSVISNTDTKLRIGTGAGAF